MRNEFSKELFSMEFFNTFCTWKMYDYQKHFWKKLKTNHECLIFKNSNMVHGIPWMIPSRGAANNLEINGDNLDKARKGALETTLTKLKMHTCRHFLMEDWDIEVNLRTRGLILVSLHLRKWLHVSTCKNWRWNVQIRPCPCHSS